jgi:hypothetical protein
MWRKQRDGGHDYELLLHKMKCILTLLVFFSSLAYGESPEATDQAKPIVSLYVVLPEATEGGSEVAPPSKSSKGFVAGRPDMELPCLLGVVHLAPKKVERDADGKLVFVDGEASLLLNLHVPETQKLEALHKKVGDVRLYIRVTAGKTSRYFDAEFAPVSDDTVFVEGTVEEKREIAELLRKLVTEPQKGDQDDSGQPASRPESK